MNQILQLLVGRRGLDPEAWTALHSLQSMRTRERVTALSVAYLWEFHWSESGPQVSRVQEWVSSANWFANPSRDLLRWRESGTVSMTLADSAATPEGGVGSSREGTYLLVSWLGDQGATEHGRAAQRLFGDSFEVRRARLWWLAVEGGSAEAYLRRHANLESGGLLLNPHSQAGRVLGSELPFPAFPSQAPKNQTLHTTQGGVI